MDEAEQVWELTEGPNYWRRLLHKQMAGKAAELKELVEQFDEWLQDEAAGIPGEIANDDGYDRFYSDVEISLEEVKKQVDAALEVIGDLGSDECLDAPPWRMGDEG